MRIAREADGRGVDVVPLIDTVFLLLVIFLVMVLRMRVDEGLSVELPSVGKSGRTETGGHRTTLVVGVARSGQVVVEGRMLREAELVSELQQRMGRSSIETLVEIRGDRLAPHGAVMAVLAAVQSAGARGIRFQVSTIRVATRIQEGVSR